MITSFEDGETFEFNGKKYPIRSETERDEGFYRYSTFIQINGKEFCPSPSHLSGSGPIWEKELVDCIKKYEILPKTTPQVAT